MEKEIVTSEITSAKIDAQNGIDITLRVKYVQMHGNRYNTYSDIVYGLRRTDRISIGVLRLISKSIR